MNYHRLLFPAFLSLGFLFLGRTSAEGRVPGTAWTCLLVVFADGPGAARTIAGSALAPSGPGASPEQGGWDGLGGHGCPLIPDVLPVESEALSDVWPAQGSLLPTGACCWVPVSDSAPPSPDSLTLTPSWCPAQQNATVTWGGV